MTIRLNFKYFDLLILISALKLIFIIISEVEEN